MTKLVDWLFEKTPDDADPAPELPAHLVSAGYLTPATDDNLAPELIDQPVPLDEVLTAIDYTDAEGWQSRRRITMRALSPGKHSPILRAVCHERRAVRNFRCDRIECFIQPDGEVIECPDFFRRVLGIDLQFVRASADVGPEIPTSDKEARALREKLRAPISVLVALARSDNDFERLELDVICDFVKKVAPEAAETPHPGDLTVLEALRPIIYNLRPSRTSLKHNMFRTEAMCYNPEFRSVFEVAVNDILHADGVISPGEVALLEELGFYAEEH